LMGGRYELSVHRGHDSFGRAYREKQRS
jgi:hypothetical protein